MVLYKQQLECSLNRLSFFDTISDRGSIVSRYFCKNCGSHVLSHISDIPELLTVKAATLDNFKNFTPDYLVWTQSAGADCPFPPEVPSFAQNAPLEILVRPRD